MPGDYTTFPTTDGDTRAYLSLPPSGSGPGLLVIQEWWGLVQHIADMTDRFAERGFVAMAPDLYRGEVAEEPDHAMTLMRELDIPNAAQALADAATYLRNHDANASGKVGCVGYCMGGGMTLLVASHGVIDAGAPFYGVLPGGLPDASSIRCPIQGHYAEHDDATASVPELERSIAGSEFFVYPGTSHAFCNDDRPDVYDADASALAMDRATAFFMRHLS